MSKARNMARMGQDTSAGYTGAFDMPAGTTAQRPASAGLGWTRLNTDTGSVEVFDGTNWNAVTRPFISSVTGTIYAGEPWNLIVAGQNFTSTITVRFIEAGTTIADVTGVAVSSGSATVAIPAAVYGQTAGDSIEIKVVNSDGTLSANSITKIVQGLPTGGSITTSGGYRYHKFTSSSNLSIPSGFSVTGQALVIAGGGGGSNGDNGNDAGAGGGAGGVVYNGSLSISTGTYSAVVGAGGAGLSGTFRVQGNSGSNSSLTSVTTAVGGGYGGRCNDAGGAGGSGGGAGGGGGGPFAGGTATSGQGNNGGTNSGTAPYSGAGDGGATGVGGNSGGGLPGGNGGAGTNAYSTWASATSSGVSGYYAGGGGGGGGISPSIGPGTGGAGGGGNGGAQENSGSGGYGGNAPANSGSGGGGAGNKNATSGSGGSGIVIVRYQLPA